MPLTRAGFKLSGFGKRKTARQDKSRTTITRFEADIIPKVFSLGGLICSLLLLTISTESNPATGGQVHEKDQQGHRARALLAFAAPVHVSI
jgi:hypothetical protein